MVCHKYENIDTNISMKAFDTILRAVGTIFAWLARKYGGPLLAHSGLSHFTLETENNHFSK